MEKGFGTVAVIGIVALVILLGGGGFFVVDRLQDKKNLAELDEFLDSVEKVDLSEDGSIEEEDLVNGDVGAGGNGSGSGQVEHQEDGVTVTQSAPRTTNYAVARTTKQPYTCTFRIPSFFGESNDGEALVLGDDFLITERGDSPFEEGATYVVYIHGRKNGWAYGWGPTDGYEEVKADVKKIEAAMSSVLGRDEMFQGYAVFFQSVPDWAECTLASHTAIVIPDKEYDDYTDEILSGLGDYASKQKEDIAAFLFTPLLPDYSGYEVLKSVTGKDDGYSDPVDFDLSFNFENDEEVIYVHEQHNDGSYDPPAHCRFGECSFVTTTPKGYKVHKEQGLTNTKPITTYHTQIGNTVVSFHRWETTSGSYNRLIFSDDRIHSFVDSFKEATDDEIFVIPDDPLNY